MTDAQEEGPPSADRSGDPVVAAVQGELVAALKRADALRAEAEEARAALERSNQQKDEFLAMLAHELRNPLGPMMNAAELLQATAADSSVQRATQILVRQTALLTRLVDDLLDAARISRGKLELRRQPVDLVALVASVADDMQASFRAREIAFASVLPGVPLWLDADPQRLTQAIGNLLSNAAKFTDASGNVTVELVGDLEHGQATLSITDTGIGMAEELLSRVFESFSQASGNEPRNPSGLGLGTAIARDVIEMHGGTIVAQSGGRGAGSTFTIRLPLHAPSTHHAAGDRPKPSTPGQRRILVIDDNVDAAEVVQVVLESFGHVVTVAHDGVSGASLARRLSPDLVLCDLGLPGEMDGLAVARNLSTIAGGPYLVALTGYGREEDRRRALEAGFDLHLTKPVSIATLERVVSELG